MFRAKPKITEVELSKKYSFMYENFALLTQHKSYLLLEKSDAGIHALEFNSRNCRYGGPNDEAHGGHPLANHGLGFYGLYQVENSPWIQEMIEENKVHPRHTDSLFSGLKHYIACFKDIKFECVCLSMNEIVLSENELSEIFFQQIEYLDA